MNPFYSHHFSVIWSLLVWIHFRQRWEEGEKPTVCKHSLRTLLLSKVLRLYRHTAGRWSPMSSRVDSKLEPPQWRAAEQAQVPWFSFSVQGTMSSFPLDPPAAAGYIKPVGLQGTLISCKVSDAERWEEHPPLLIMRKNSKSKCLHWQASPQDTKSWSLYHKHVCIDAN